MFIDNLPLELELLIFKDISKTSMLQCLLVCKTWHRVLAPFCFNQVTLSRKHAQFVAMLSKPRSNYQKYTQKIILKCRKSNLMSIDDFSRLFSFLPHLIEIEFQGRSYLEWFLQNIIHTDSNNLKGVKRISINDSLSISKHLKLLYLDANLRLCDSITYLSLGPCIFKKQHELIDYVSKFKQLKELHLRNTCRLMDFIDILSACPLLHTFSFNCIYSIEDNSQSCSDLPFERTIMETAYPIHLRNLKLSMNGLKTSCLEYIAFYLPKQLTNLKIDTLESSLTPMFEKYPITLVYEFLNRLGKIENVELYSSYHEFDLLTTILRYGRVPLMTLDSLRIINSVEFIFNIFSSLCNTIDNHCRTHIEYMWDYKLYNDVPEPRFFKSESYNKLSIRLPAGKRGHNILNSGETMERYLQDQYNLFVICNNKQRPLLSKVKFFTLLSPIHNDFNFIYDDIFEVTEPTSVFLDTYLTYLLDNCPQLKYVAIVHGGNGRRGLCESLVMGPIPKHDIMSHLSTNSYYRKQWIKEEKRNKRMQMMTTEEALRYASFENFHITKRILKMMTERLPNIEHILLRDCVFSFDQQENKIEIDLQGFKNLKSFTTSLLYLKLNTIHIIHILVRKIIHDNDKEVKSTMDRCYQVDLDTNLNIIVESSLQEIEAIRDTEEFLLIQINVPLQLNMNLGMKRDTVQDDYYFVL
ncbi:uncharacterized protein BX663DRAFT_523059 [Cokeromyces recurvatus]|uniref:uncharacterized protein n=1 Tax=Cokeromyces recurvatus TaxID=90255 RepID=UPI0022210E12|nr:uncharacterized protein BX663DRAFT_523059 [Cokeromyces recurvatus]KAI7898851.1 hypothetical protein BX663DRAFT_523059 [Cokeromyces recurvatus]